MPVGSSTNVRTEAAYVYKNKDGGSVLDLGQGVQIDMPPGHEGYMLAHFYYVLPAIEVEHDDEYDLPTAEVRWFDKPEKTNMMVSGLYGCTCEFLSRGVLD